MGDTPTQLSDAKRKFRLLKQASLNQAFDYSTANISEIVSMIENLDGILAEYNELKKQETGWGQGPGENP